MGLTGSLPVANISRALGATKRLFAEFLPIQHFQSKRCGNRSISRAQCDSSLCFGAFARRGQCYHCAYGRMKLGVLCPDLVVDRSLRSIGLVRFQPLAKNTGVIFCYCRRVDCAFAGSNQVCKTVFPTGVCRDCGIQLGCGRRSHSTLFDHCDGNFKVRLYAPKICGDWISIV